MENSSVYRWSHSSDVLLSSSPEPLISAPVPNPELTHHGHRTRRQTILSPNLSRRPERTTRSAISASLNLTHNHNTSQDVPPFVNHSAALSTSSTVPRTGSINSNQHGLKNNSESPSQVSSLAHHYGIPMSLPRPPRTTPRTSSARTSVSPPQEPIPDFESLSRNYLSMLASKPADNTTSTTTMPTDTTTLNPAAGMAPPPAPVPRVEDQAAALQAAVDTLIASPEFAMLSSPEFAMGPSSFDEFLTSPNLSTPYDDFSTSPMDDSPFAPDLNTPIMDSIDEFGWCADDSFGMMGQPLFDDAASALYTNATNVVVEPEPVAKVPTPAPPTTAEELLKNHNLYTLSPETPVLDSMISLYPSPRLPSTHSFPSPTPSSSVTPAPSATAQSTIEAVSVTSSNAATRRKSGGANGTRRNITPATLVPLDAPTQPRRYLSDSSTSRKELPAVFAKKRSRAEAFNDDGSDDEDGGAGPAPGPNATEREQIEWKRRQNTIAARKSRKRKLEHQQMLEGMVEELNGEKEKWRMRCRVLEEILRSHGINFRFEDEEPL